MSHAEPGISVKFDATNPGQFFSCCGLLELADRLSPGAEGWFEMDRFHIASHDTLGGLLEAVVMTRVEQLNPDDEMASPMRLSDPFGLTLDWWTDELAGGKQLKVWAGSMRGVRIVRAMQQAMKNIENSELLLDFASVVHDPDQPRKKVEPFYFDSRRGANAQARDIGFAPDSLNMTTAAYPAVEFLCLVGLQRCRPRPTESRRVFRYTTWARPLPVRVAPAAVCGVVPTSGARTYQFENAFRTDQRKHKAFLPATAIGAFS